MKQFYLTVSLIGLTLFAPQVYAATSVPAELKSVNIVEDDTPGQVTVSWKAVTYDAVGNELPADEVSYNIYVYDVATDQPGKVVATGIKDTAYSFTAYNGSAQAFVRYYVCAANSAGEGKGLDTESIPVGHPYTNFHATFADGKSKYAWSTGETAEGVMMGLLTDKSGFPSQDGDNGLLGISAESSGTVASIRSAKISLAGLSKPSMTFYTYNLGSAFSHDDNIVTVKVRTPGGDFTKVYENTVWYLAHDVEGWAKVTVDLSQFAGKDIEFSLGGKFVSDGALLFDNISFPELPANDLSLLSINAPKYVEGGKNFNVSVTVANNGSEPADNWSVTIKANGEEIQTLDGVKIFPEQSEIVGIECRMSAIADDPVEYTAILNYPLDSNPLDNELDYSVTVTPVLSQLPYVKTIKGEGTESDVRLSWTAPDLDAIPRQITEDFETAESFAAEFGDWTFTDADQSPIGGFKNVQIPNITAGETTGSFWVWDGEAKLADAKAHSGTKFLFSMYREDDGQVDDWAISPELYPTAQTIGFYAASWTQFYPDKVEVWYSKGTKDLKDFVKVEGAGGEVPEGATSASDWTHYTAALPEGAKYFAIRSCATGGFMLMVDDVTYRPLPANTGMTFEGYNIYRNGEKLNAEPLTETSYTDANGTMGETYGYQVTAVYSGGESRGSKIAKVVYGMADIETIDVDTESDHSSPIYDITGRQVKEIRPGGFYIQNHKKIIGK